MPCFSFSTISALTLAATMQATCMPVSSMHITQRFIKPEFFYSAGHRGIDIAAEPDQPIYAIRSGHVHFAGLVASTGWVSIDHGGGLISTYGPIQEPISLWSGQAIAAGQEIGVLAEEEHHLNLGVKVPDPKRKGRYRYLDPLSILVPWEVATRPVR